MIVRPIIFSAAMVRALLDGRKTQTRRLATSPLAKVEPGDLLYVRENFHATKGFSKPVIGPHAHLFGFDVTGTDREFVVPNIGRVREFASHLGGWGGRSSSNCPSIHLPRWASRLTLEVTETKIERLHEISPQDAIAESIDYEKHRCGCERCSMSSIICPGSASSLILEFAELWDSIHGKGTWDKNPEVVALTFRVHKCNVDQMAKEAA